MYEQFNFLFLLGVYADSKERSFIPVVEAQLRTAMYLAEENLPNRKFLSLIDLQIGNGANAFEDKKGLFTNHQAVSTSNFQKYIANV